MKQYQVYAGTTEGKLVHAGVHQLGNISEHTVTKLERKWLAWRHNYCISHPGSYPLKDHQDNTNLLILHELGNLSNKYYFNFIHGKATQTANH